MDDKGLGRRIPTTWKHVDKYPLRRMMAKTVDVAERTLSLPGYRVQYDQGAEGACVGFSCSWLMSIMNRRLYSAPNLYHEAQVQDEWNDTPPEEGTSVRAALDVLRALGHWRVAAGKVRPVSLDDGILENRWASTIDEIRTVIQSGTPVVLGINWYANFQTPVQTEPPSTQNGRHKEWWIGRGDLGRVRGGHAICAYRVSDRRQAIGLINTWGNNYPPVWIPYPVVERLIGESGEVGLVTDRIPPALQQPAQLA